MLLGAGHNEDVHAVVGAENRALKRPTAPYERKSDRENGPIPAAGQSAQPRLQTTRRARCRTGVEPGPQRPEGSVIRRSREPGEAERCPQKLAALVEHGLFDHLIRTKEQ